MSDLEQEHREQLTELLRAKRKELHVAEMQLARMGELYAPVGMIIQRDDLKRECRALEQQLGIERQAPAPYTPRYSPAPIPAEDFARQMAAQQERQRQQEAAHHMTLLTTYRRNLAHWRAQAKAYGGIDLAPPVTRHGMNEARQGIADAKRALERLGVAVDTLPGDE